METFTGVLFETETTLAGAYPDIPVAETVLAALGSDPVFVTLPLGAVGAKSLNGRRYNQESIRVIADTINREKSIGQKGHLRDDQRPYVFEIPPLMWLGAQIDENGTLWGKAFILESFPEVREYIKVAKLNKARVGTSIYGTGEMDEDGTVHHLKIESIDLAHPGRLGVPLAAAIPAVTAEMQQNMPTQSTGDPSARLEDPAAEVEAETTIHQDSPINQDGGEMPTIQELENQLTELRRQHAEQMRDVQVKLNEHRNQLADFAKIAELLGKPQDVVIALQVLQVENKDLKRENGELLQESIRGQVAHSVKVEKVRPVIEKMIRDRNPPRRVDVTTSLEEILQLDYVKTLLQIGVQETMGPGHERPAQQVSESTASESLMFIPGVF